MKKHYENYGRLMRIIRKDFGLSQGKLSRQINIHVQFVSNVERGQCAYPIKNLRSFLKLVKDNPYSSLRLCKMLDRAIAHDQKLEREELLKEMFKGV